MLIAFIVAGVALAVIMAAVRIVIGWVSAPALVRFNRLMRIADQIFTVAVAVAILAVVGFFVFAVFTT